MLNSTYRNILIENGVNKDKISSNYKKYIKELIQDNITNVVFIPNKQKNKPERIMTNLTQVEALNTYIDNEAEEQDFKTLWWLSKKIRNDVLSKKWEFDGSFDKYEPPNLLLTCLKWILLGPHKQDSTDLAKRTADIEVLTKTTSQFKSQNIKTTRQTNYHLQTIGSTMTSKIETPLNIGIGLYAFHTTRSKKLINFLSDLNVSANYNKVNSIKKDIFDAVLEKK